MKRFKAWFGPVAFVACMAVWWGVSYFKRDDPVIGKELADNWFSYWVANLAWGFIAGTWVQRKFSQMEARLAEHGKRLDAMLWAEMMRLKAILRGAGAKRKSDDPIH